MSASFPARVARVVRRFRPSIRRHRRWLIQGMLGTLVVVACRLAFPWPLRGVLELAFNESGGTVTDLVPAAGDPVAWLVGAFVAIVLLQGVAELVQRLSFARFAIGVVQDGRAEALERLRSRGAGAGIDVGDTIARVIGDSARFKSGLKGVLIRMTQNGTFFVGVCVVLLWIDPLLGAVFVVGGTVILTVAALGAARISTISRRMRKKEGKLANYMHALLSGDDEAREEVAAGEQREGRAEAKTTRLEGQTMLLVHGLLAATTCTALVLGLQAVRSGRLQPADLFTVLFYLLLVHNPTVRLGRQAVRIGRVLASAERLVKVMDGRAERPAEDGPAIAAERADAASHADVHEPAGRVAGLS